MNKKSDTCYLNINNGAQSATQLVPLMIYGSPNNTNNANNATNCDNFSII